MTRQNDRARWLFFLGLAALYAGIFLLLRTTTLFDTGGHNDRLFSADDLYYVTKFFSVEMDTSPRIIKHPLLIVFGCLFTRAEALLLSAVSLRRHYQLIVLMQMGAALLSIGFLDRILERRYRLEMWRALLVCTVYALAFSTLFYTFVPESYILSALMLTASYWYAGEGKTVPTVLFGALAAGVTITNAALWALIVFFSGGTLRRRLLVLASAGGLFCLSIALLPIRTVFFTTLISGALGSAQSYSDHFGLAEAVVRTFFALFCSPFFLLNMAETSPFGDFPGDALSFLPSASVPIVLAGVLWLALLAFSVIKNRRCLFLRAPLSVLAANILLHGVIQYGLKEGFLYCLHHLPAQLLIAALVLRPEERPAVRRIATAAFAAMLAAELLLNLSGYRVLIAFLMR